MNKVSSAIDRIKVFFHRPFFTDFRTLFCVWMLIPVYAFYKNMKDGEPENTYHIFRYVYIHAMKGLTLFGEYPGEYLDENHYGPFFSLFIAPLAVLPISIGYFLWLLLIVFTLYVAIRTSTFSRSVQIFLLWFCANEMLTCTLVAQFNGVIAALLIFAFVAVEKERDEWATFALLLGTFIKLYGIVALPFFFFSKRKKKFIISFIVWSIVFFVTPMLITSPEYIVGQYADWYHSLSIKNELNIHSWDQNISFLGIVRRWTGCTTYSDLWLIVPGLILMALCFFRTTQWKSLQFRYMTLASIMMFATLFSTGTESYGHIISLVAVVIWYTSATWKRDKWDMALLVLSFVLTSLCTTDIYPQYIRKTYIFPYTLKALPITLIWFKLCYEMLTRNYLTTEPEAECIKYNDK